MDRCLVPRGRWLQRGVWALAVGLLLAACGGGVGTGGTGAFASGPITGFGSIIVDGVHFDESMARIEADDGTGRDRSELRLGTMVEVQSDDIRDGAATATQVRIASALIGRVDSVGANVVVVNGVTVRVNAGTVIDDRFVGGVGGIAVGQVVEVYGYVAPTEIVASRIEPDNGASAFKFRGNVTALDARLGTFDIGSQHFVYSATVSGSDELRIGAFVRVIVATQPDAQGRWVVSAVGNTGPGSSNRDQAKARGVITAFTSNASFAVGGFVVDASSAQIEGGPLAAGLRVEVEGRLVAGVLVAAKVAVQDPDTPDEIDLRGVIANLDAGAKVFQISGRAERVSYARNDIVYDKGTAADLAPGRRVRVTGQLSADGTLVEATSIRFEGN